MTRSDAISKMLASFQDEPQVITPKGRSYEEYIEEQSTELLDRVVEPEKVVITSACFPEYYLKKYQATNVWAIAKWQDNWLLTLEDENEFALAFGESKNNLMMLGFSSSDALAEWLG